MERRKSLIQVPGVGCRNWQDGQNGDETLRRHSFQVAGAMGFFRDIEYKASSAFIYTKGPLQLWGNIRFSDWTHSAYVTSREPIVHKELRRASTLATKNLRYFAQPIFIEPKSDHCLALKVSRLLEFCSNCWICQSCYMNFSMLFNVFVKIDTWISLCC